MAVQPFMCCKCELPTILGANYVTECCGVKPRCETCEKSGRLFKDPFADRKGAWCDSCMLRMLELRRRQPIDPIKFAAKFWPHVKFYKEQMEIIYSVLNNDETVVVAGNQLGKDFVAGYICLYWFLTGGGRGFDIQTRIITTSVNKPHLDVLWGEIHQFIDTCVSPLNSTKGGPLIVLQQEIRKTIKTEDGRIECPKSYLKAMVSGRAQGMTALAGHHAESTLAIGDEASGLDDLAFDKLQGWTKRRLYIGNPNDCQNYYRRAVREGDIIDPSSLSAA